MRRPSKTFAAICIFVTAVLVTSFLMAEVNHWTTLYPSIGTQSDFIKNYSPANVVSHFRIDEGGSTADGTDASAGKKFVTYKRNMGMTFTSRPAEDALLRDAVYKDILCRLKNDKAYVRQQPNTGSEERKILYHFNNTAGSVTLLPVRAATEMHRNIPLPKDLRDTVLSVKIEENWYPNAAPVDLNAHTGP